MHTHVSSIVFEVLKALSFFRVMDNVMVTLALLISGLFIMLLIKFDVDFISTTLSKRYFTSELCPT